MESDVRARVSMFMRAPPERVFASFVEPDLLCKFWLSSASGPLQIGKVVHWKFMVKGEEVDTTATVMTPGKQLAWAWSDGSKVRIDLESLDAGTAVTLVNDGFPKGGEELVAAALNATEGFAIVLADLKTLLESGESAGITKAKAKLIALRR